MTEPGRADLVVELIDRYALADRHGAVRRTRQLLAAGVDEEILVDVVGDAQREVGALWQSDAWTISQEHAATAIAESVLATLDDARPPAEARGRVAMVAADGEWHVLPARLAAHAFERAGIHVRFLGGSIPPDDLVRTLPTSGVDGVAISVTLARNLPGAARTVAAAHAAGLPVVIGGQAVDPARAETLGADVHAAHPRDAVAGVLGWAQHGAPRPLARSSLQAGAAAGLRAARTELEADAFRELTRTARLDDDTDAVQERVLADLDVHLAHLEAAVLLDDASVYAEAVGWLSSVLAARGADDLLELELAALEVVLAAHPDAQALVRGLRA
jgi:methanogenic corrinoid protein MtbC1